MHLKTYEGVANCYELERFDFEIVYLPIDDKGLFVQSDERMLNLGGININGNIFNSFFTVTQCSHFSQITVLNGEASRLSFNNFTNLLDILNSGLESGTAIEDIYKALYLCKFRNYLDGYVISLMRETIDTENDCIREFFNDRLKYKLTLVYDETNFQCCDECNLFVRVNEDSKKVETYLNLVGIKSFPIIYDFDLLYNIENGNLSVVVKYNLSITKVKEIDICTVLSKDNHLYIDKITFNDEILSLRVNKDKGYEVNLSEYLKELISLQKFKI